MILDMANFGNMLMSRTSGREDLLKAEAYIFSEIKDEEIILDFKNVKVLAPSWADEFITPLIKKYQLTYINTENPSVTASLQMVLDPVDVTKYEKK